MRITFLGVLSIVAVFLVLAYAGQQIERRLNEPKAKDEQTRTDTRNNPDQSCSL